MPSPEQKKILWWQSLDSNWNMALSWFSAHWSTLKMWIFLIFKIASANLLNTYLIGYLFICKILHQISPSCGVISNCSVEQPWKAVSKFYKNKYSIIWISGFPWWLSHRELACQCRRHRRHGFDPWVRKIPLEEKVVTYSSILAGKTPWAEEPGRLQSIGSQRWVMTEGLSTQSESLAFNHTVSKILVRVL